MKLIYFLLLIVIGASCSHARYINNHIDEIRNRICVDSVNTNIQFFHKDSMSIKDTLILSVLDSASIRLFFKCDSNYQVLLDKYTIQQGKGIKTSFNFQNGMLLLSCDAEIKRLERLIEYYKLNKEIVIKQNIVKIKVPEIRKWHEMVPWYIWSITGIIALSIFWLGRKTKLNFL